MQQLQAAQESGGWRMDSTESGSEQKVVLCGVQSQAGCQTCQHSVGHSEGLWCNKWDCESFGYCDEYNYEPGTI